MKEITLKIESKIDKKTKTLLEELFGLFSDKDVYCEISGDEIIIYLKSIDFSLFENKIEDLKKEVKSSKSEKILDTIYKSIRNIKSYGIKEKKRIYAGYNDERKVKGRKEKVASRNSKKNKNKIKIEHNILDKKYENKIICGDSLKILKKIPGNSIDLIFTSPPYNFGLDYESNYDANNWDKYFTELFNIFDEGIRVLKHGGRFVVNIQPLFSDYIPSHHIVCKYFLDRGMLWKGEILWEKNNYNCKYTAWGSWKSPSSPYLKYTWEFVEVFAKGDLKKTGEKENADITAEEFKKWVVAKWSIAPERTMKEFDHPAMFPEELAKRVLKLFSFKGDIILDPFNGVGTTTSVADELNRKYIGIDISKEYCKKAKDRIKKRLL